MSTFRKRHARIEAANPMIDLNPCLEKARLETEEARKQSSFRPYFCAWCQGWHTSQHGFKGSRRGR